MAESTDFSQFHNPCLLHLQKMGLELKCPMCLNLLSQPTLLCCNHIFCSPCISKSMKSGLECPVCKLPYLRQELRPAPHMENMVNIYRSMEAAFVTLLRAEFHIGVSGKLNVDEKLRNETRHKIHRENPNDFRSTRPSFPANKRVQVSLNPMESEVETPEGPVKPSKLRGEGETGEPVRLDGENSIGNAVDLGLVREEGSANEKDAAFAPFSWFRDQESEENGSGGGAVHDLTSTPPFGDLKDSDNESNDQGIKNNDKKLLTNGLNKKGSEDASNLKEYARSFSPLGPYHVNLETDILVRGSSKKNKRIISPIDDDHYRESKRQSMFNGGLQDSVTRSGRVDLNIDSDNEITGVTLEHDNIKVGVPYKVPEKNPCQNSGAVSVDIDATEKVFPAIDLNLKAHRTSCIESFQSLSKIVCAFCHSAEESEASGPMFHYENGKAVVADRLIQSNVLHVHKKCAEWAPNVYFVDEIAVNLEAEVARGGKIKCSGCGLKGAALGCYARICRRSYHVPCAVEILECRWDTDNFVMLCPVHSSFKLPNERSKSGKKMRATSSPATQLPHQESSGYLPCCATNIVEKIWTDPTGMADKWVLCGAALSAAEKDLLVEFANLTGAIVSKAWNPNVTHLISSTDESGACKRTLKFLMAILSGRWILNMDWIKACMKAMHPVSEEPYEINRDIHGCSDGPKTGRARIMQKRSPLFGGLNFYFCGFFVSSYKGYLEDLILAAGGTVLQPGSILGSHKSNTEGTPSTIVLYSLDLPESCTSLEGSSILEQRFKEAGALASEIGALVSGHQWLLESIAASKLQPLLC